jgi:D-alanyl-D-alanine dipeptidase/carboxypeptidase
MDRNQLSLEEYVKFIKNYKYGKEHLQTEMEGIQIEVGYVPAKGKQTVIAIPKQSVCQVSGNNVDGFIITLWRDRNE